MKVIKELKTSWLMERNDNGTYHNGYQHADGTEPVVAFKAGIVFDTYQRGQTSTVFIFHDANDKRQKYHFGPNSMNSLMEALRDGAVKLTDGIIHGKFKFAKQGQNVYTTVYGE